MENVIQLYHAADPCCKELWHFCYLHGKAEDWNEMVAHDNNYWGRDWEAPDLCGGENLPTEPGEYKCMLYGLPVTMFVAYRGNLIGGRGAHPGNEPAYSHASGDPKNWR